MARIDEDGVVQDEDGGNGQNGVAHVAEGAEYPVSRRSVEELTAASVGELALLGEHAQLSFDVDLGKVREGAPLSSSVAAKLPKLWVDGQYQVGDRVSVTVEFEVEAVGFVPVKDKGMRIGTERVHRAEYVGHRRS